jgi:hypothetical protein
VSPAFHTLVLVDELLGVRLRRVVVLVLVVTKVRSIVHDVEHGENHGWRSHQDEEREEAILNGPHVRRVDPLAGLRRSEEIGRSRTAADQRPLKHHDTLLCVRKTDKNADQNA